MLDVNVLIALLDTDHVAHKTALDWFSANAPHGWASCPITQNGCLRIMSGSRYSGTKPMHDVATRLRGMTDERVHEFWPDNITLLNSETVDMQRILGPGQLTDVYLLALAVSHGGRFVTLDKSIAISAVRGATQAHVVTL